jgi:hypothetical protein
VGLAQKNQGLDRTRLLRWSKRKTVGIVLIAFFFVVCAFVGYRLLTRAVPVIAYAHHLSEPQSASTEEFVFFEFPGLPIKPVRTRSIVKRDINWDLRLQPLPNADGTDSRVSYHGLGYLTIPDYSDGKMPSACTIRLRRLQGITWQCEISVTVDEYIACGPFRLPWKRYIHLWTSAPVANLRIPGTARIIPIPPILLRPHWSHRPYRSDFFSHIPCGPKPFFLY